MLTLFLFSFTFVSSAQPTQQSNKIFVNPFYQQSTSSDTNYTYTLDVSPPDGISGVKSAIISFDVYLTPTVNFQLWVNNKPCNNPTFQVHTTYSSAGQARINFDCSNVITQSGTYTIKMTADKNTGALNGWLDLTYMNNPKADMTIHGTEYQYGQAGKVWLQLINSSGDYINDGICYVDIYTPAGGYYIEGSTMNNMNHDGIYYYDLEVPTQAGVYLAIAKCYYIASQFKKNATDYTIYNGKYDGGTINDTYFLDTVYLKLKTDKNGGLTLKEKLNVTFNFTSFYSSCGNISEALMTGLTISWNGVWNTGTLNHDINIYAYNYSSNSWVTLSNKIFGGQGGDTQQVSNSLSTNNFTKSLGITATKSLKIRMEDTDGSGDGAKDFKTDYLYASCDQLANPQWQEIKGSSELHITSPTPYLIDDGGLEYAENSSFVVTLANGTNVSYIYYAGMFKHKFTIGSGVSVNQSNYRIEYQGMHSIPCNAIIGFYKINSTGYFPYPYTTQRQTEEDHCSINFYTDLNVGQNQDFEIYARNVWESDLRSTKASADTLYPLMSSACDLWALLKGEPYPYVIPKIAYTITYSDYYDTCANWYDDYYWFNKTYNQVLTDQAIITDRDGYLQYESDYTSAKYAQDKLNTIMNTMTSTMGVIADYSKLLIENQLNRTNTLDAGIWANYSTIYRNYLIVNASCGTGVCNVNQSFLANINYTAISQSVWSYPARNLTYFPVQLDKTNYSKIPLFVWNSTSRTLTEFNFTINATVNLNLTAISENVWAYTNRNLTWFPQGNTITPQDIWEYSNRSLTEFNFIVDTTINLSDIPLQVWSYNNRSLTLFITPQDIWNYTNRNLTYFPTPPLPNNLTAEDVWNFVNRNLTYYQNNQNLTAQEIWEYVNRSLTEFNFQVNAIVNTTAIAESVWNWNGLISGNLLSQIASSIWNWTGSISSTIGDFFSDRVWTRTDRNLTFYNNTEQVDLTNYTKIPLFVWNSTERNLTYYPDTSNSTVIAEAVWNYSGNITTNILSQFKYNIMNTTAIAEDVWNYSARYTHGVILN